MRLFGNSSIVGVLKGQYSPYQSATTSGHYSYRYGRVVGQANPTQTPRAKKNLQDAIAQGNLIACLAWINKAWKSPQAANVRRAAFGAASRPQCQKLMSMVADGTTIANGPIATWTCLGLPMPATASRSNRTGILIGKLCSGQIRPTTKTIPGVSGYLTVGADPCVAQDPTKADAKNWKPSPGLESLKQTANALSGGEFGLNVGGMLQAFAKIADTEMPVEDAIKEVLRNLPLGIGVAFNELDKFVTSLGELFGIGQESEASKREKQWREWIKNCVPKLIAEYQQYQTQIQAEWQQAQKIKQRAANDPRWSQTLEGQQALEHANMIDKVAPAALGVLHTQVGAVTRESEYANQLAEEAADPSKRAERHAAEVAKQEAGKDSLTAALSNAKQAAEMYQKAADQMDVQAALLKREAQIAQMQAKDAEERNRLIEVGLGLREPKDKSEQAIAGAFKHLWKGGAGFAQPGADVSAGITSEGEGAELARQYQANRAEAEAAKGRAMDLDREALRLKQEADMARQQEQEANRKLQLQKQQAEKQAEAAGVIARVATGQGTPEDKQKLTSNPALQVQYKTALEAIEITQGPIQVAPPYVSPRPSTPPPVFTRPAYVPRQPEPTFTPTASLTDLMPITQPQTAPQPQLQQYTPISITPKEATQQDMMQAQAERLAAMRCRGLDASAQVRPGAWCISWNASTQQCLQTTSDCLDSRVKGKPALVTQPGVMPAAPRVTPSTPAPVYTPGPGQRPRPSMQNIVPYYGGERIN